MDVFLQRYMDVLVRGPENSPGRKTLRLATTIKLIECHSQALRPATTIKLIERHNQALRSQPTTRFIEHRNQR